MTKLYYHPKKSGVTNKNFEKDIDLKKLFNVIKKRFWIVIISILIFTTIGGMYSYKFTTPLYQSSARYLLEGLSPDQAGTYNVIIKDSSILDKVIEKLNLDTTSESLSEQIAIVNDSQVVTIIVTGSSPILNTRITNTLLTTFQEEIQKITGYTGVKVISEAKNQDNMVPINQGHLKKIMISFVIGLITGIGLVFFLNSLDDTITSVNDIELLLEVPVLGRVSKARKIPGRKMKKIEQNLLLRGESYGSK